MKKDNFLTIQIDDRVKRSFSLGLIEIEGEDKDMPSWEFSSIVEMQSLDLVSAIEDCGVVSDACSFVIENEKFIIEAKSLEPKKSHPKWNGLVTLLSFIIYVFCDELIPNQTGPVQIER